MLILPEDSLSLIKKTQEMCDKAFDTFTFIFNSVPDWYKTQEVCNKSVFQETFLY